MTHLITFLALLLLTVPALAAGPTKGTKSYQNYNSDSAEQTADTTDEMASNMDEFDPDAIEPAAGEMEEASEEEKAMHETMRLPRKN